MQLSPLRALGLLIAMVTSLAACSVDCPPRGIESAAAYGNKFFSEKEPEYKRSANLPKDVWVRNPDVEEFLRSTLRTEGFSSLATKYGMQCTPRPQPAGCADCYECIASFPARVMSFSLAPACVDYGSVWIRAEIGPGQMVAAMTYRHVRLQPGDK